MQDTGDRIGTAFTGHVHKELVFLERKEAAEGSGRAQLETHHKQLFSTLAFFLGEVGSKPPKPKGPHIPHQGIFSKTKSSWYSSLWCPCGVCHSIILRGLWRLSGYLQSQHRLPSPWPLLDSLSLPRGAHEKQTCLQLVTDLSLQGFQCFSTLFFLHLQGFWSPK